MNDWIRKTLQLASTALVILSLASCISHARVPISLPDIDSSTAPNKNITIALLGATGMVGGFILQEALTQGYDIRALARTPKKLDSVKDRITIVQGDARDLATIEELLRGSDVVFSALGPVKADGDSALTISTVATGHIISLMPTLNIQRYMLVSGAGITIPGDERNFTGWLIQKMASFGLSDVLKDKQAEYQLLADSTVPWTLIRCPLIDPEPFETEPVASMMSPSSFGLRAGELARFMVDQIGSEEFVGKGPFLYSP